MTVYSQGKLELWKGEECDSTRIVNASGHIPIKQKIDAYFLSGQNLQTWRREHYDHPDGVIKKEQESMPFDPTRDLGFDPADADRMRTELLARQAAENDTPYDSQNPAPVPEVKKDESSEKKDVPVKENPEKTL